MSKLKDNPSISEALREKSGHVTSIGGQAVMEGVMMRGKRMYAMAVRRPDGEIEMILQNLRPVTDRLAFLKWPILRGIVAFVDSLVLGMKITSRSAEIAGMEDDSDGEPSRFEKFLEEKLGDKINEYFITFAVVLAVILAVGLFMVLPVGIGRLFNPLLSQHTWALGVVEGLIRIGIFLAYILLISRMKEIRRVFQYHGAEHKTINCFESGAALTVENVRKHTRLHKRCGTSFLLIVMMLSMLVFMFVRTDVFWLRILSRVILAPVIAGLSYELIKWAGRSDNWLVSLFSYPGLALQKATTAEPDDDQIETAIAAMSAVLEAEPEDAK